LTRWDIVKLTNYLTSIEANAAEFREVRGSYFPNKQALPASTSADAAPREPRW
jgi:enamine deaminase RidA (YjgF/YER057c/UK114 family)